MRYVYLSSLVICLLLGGYVGSRFFSRTELRTVPVTVTKVQTVTKEVVKQADGTVVEREVVQIKDQTETRPQPKPQYRVGVLLPLQSELQLDKATVSISRRAFGQLWLDLQYDIKHKEIKAGLSYEF